MSNNTSRINTYIEAGRLCAQKESRAVIDMIDKIDHQFAEACDLIMACRGRIILTGIGKSGHIARKIAATFSSTGTPSYYIHPGEASHGDLGMVTRDDLVIAISHSGTTNELLSLIPRFKRLGNVIISMSGNKQSPLAEFANVNLDVSVNEEACPLNLAPTSSTTVALVMGDSLAIALLEARGFRSEDFALSHPGGTLGRKLILRCEDLMHTGDALPSCRESQTLSGALTEMTEKGFGLITIVDEQKQLLGIFTDGDLRRCVNKKLDLNTVVMSEVMTKSPRTVSSETLAAEALCIMEKNHITALVIEDPDQNTMGVLHMHDLLRAGIY